MAGPATDFQPIRFLRRLSGMMELPTLEYPVSDTSTVFRKGDAIIVDTSAANGKVTKGANVAGRGVPGTGILANTNTGLEGLVGFFYGPSATAPPFPTAAGVQGTYTSPASVTNEPGLVPGAEADEFISVGLALADVIWIGALVTGAAGASTNLTAPDRQAHLLRIFGLSVDTPTGAVPRTYVDVGVTGANGIAWTQNWAYPQLPQARGTGAAADPYRIRIAAGQGGADATATTNPMVEFVCSRATLWTPSV